LHKANCNSDFEYLNHLKILKALLGGASLRGGGLVSIVLVLTLIIHKYLKLRKENHMKHNKNKTTISNVRNAVTETIWAIRTSIAADAAPKLVN
jgi:hypothetical protein